MKLSRKKSTVKMTDDGVTYCENCKEELLCNEYGDMPDYCPACGRELDWTEFVRLTTDSDQPEEESQMKPSLCETCMHGQKSVGPITFLDKGHMKIVMTGGYSTICNCKNIKSISVSDSGMICSEYEKKPDELKGELK